MALTRISFYPEVKKRPDRLHPKAGAHLELPAQQPWAIVTFLKVTGSILLVPLEFLFSVITWPIKHIWLLLKFSPLVKSLRSLKPSAKAAPAAPAVQTTTAPALPVVEGFESEEIEELNDALSPKYDQLALNWYWWILELIPMKFRDQKGRRDDFFVRSNCGKGRKIYGDAFEGGLKVHRSVKTRLSIVKSNGESDYEPKAWFKKWSPEKKRKVAGPTTWNIPDSEQSAGAPFIWVE